MNSDLNSISKISDENSINNIWDAPLQDSFSFVILPMSYVYPGVGSYRLVMQLADIIIFFINLYYGDPSASLKWHLLC